MSGKWFLPAELLGINALHDVAPGGQILHVLDQRKMLVLLETRTFIGHGGHDFPPLIVLCDQIAVDLAKQHADGPGILEGIGKQVDESALDIADTGGFQAQLARRQLHQVANAVRRDSRAPAS